MTITRLFILFFTAILSGCHLVDPSLPCPKREYGHHSKDSIAVTAKDGFRHPGVHHVRRGTTLREFLQIAVLLPDREWGDAEFRCGCRVEQSRDGKPTGFLSRAKPTEKQLDTPLEEGAIVSVIKWNL